ncbi:MAG: hypothetical protein QNJ55_36490 [Xenococcus sp. MO_188.B8]|nr:hypothetical protein [Xenococcus sp. MO_188.B8]
MTRNRDKYPLEFPGVKLYQKLVQINDLEIFIGQVKKSRRHITGRKNTQSFIRREGSAVAILFALPIDTD